MINFLCEIKKEKSKVKKIDEYTRIERTRNYS